MPVDRLGAADVAEAGLRPVRADAERGQPAVLRQWQRLCHRSGEGGGVGDQVVGRQHQQQRIGIVLQCLQRTQRDCRRGVAGQWFQHDRGAFDARFQQLVGGEEAVILAGHHERRGHFRQRAGACNGLLEQRALAGQFEKLLGQVPARHRPQPGAAAAAENEGNQHELNVLGRMLRVGAHPVRDVSSSRHKKRRAQGALLRRESCADWPLCRNVNAA